MSKIISFAIRERKVTISLALVIVLFGMYSYYLVPKQENPDTSSPAAQIVVKYPGASASDVEKQITKPVEDVIATLEGIDYIKSYSYDNVSIALVMLNYDVDYNSQWDELRKGMVDLESKLPSGSLGIEIKSNLTEAAGFILFIGGENISYDRLSEYGELLKEELEVVSGVKKVDILGNPNREIVVEVKNKIIHNYGLSINELLNIIKSQNVVIPSGALDNDLGKINIKAAEGFNSLSDIKNMVVHVSGNNGSLVRLGDIAKVYYRLDEDETRFQNNGKRGILVTGYFMDRENIVLSGKEVSKKLEEIIKAFPQDIIIEKVLFMPDDVNESINDFIMNLLQGMILVALVVFWGMGRRNAIVVSITIPLSICFTFLMMYLLKLDIQQVSIAALIISLGILVDNSIVICDSIQVKMNAGVERERASIDGTREQIVPVFTSTLTTIGAFIPLMSLPGEAGEFAETLPIVVMIALSASFLVAMFVTPALASIFFQSKESEKDRLKTIKKVYSALLNVNLKNPKKIIALGIIILIFSSLFFSFIDVRMFPYVDKDIIYLNLTSERSGDLKSTGEYIDKVEKVLRKQAEILSITSSIGGGMPRFYMTADIVTPSIQRGQIYCRFDLSKSGRFSDREEFALYLQKLVNTSSYGGFATVNLLEINMPGPDIEVKLTGKDINKVNHLADEIFEDILSISGTYDVQNGKKGYSYQYFVDVNEDLASTFGLTKYDIQYQMNLSVNGAVASILKVNGNEYDIYLESDVSNIDDVKNISIKSPYSGDKVLLKQISKISLIRQLSSIVRYDRKPLVSVSAKTRPEFGVSSIQSEIENFLREKKTEGVKYDFGGDSETIGRYLAGLFVAAFVALVIIYLILLIQFNSFKQPIIILVSIPLSFIGVTLALLITGTNFTFTVGLGIASLFGIVVNNAILLIEHINRGRREGLSVEEACKESVQKRIRAILLSSITTVFGLIPLAISGSSFFSPMAIALIGGLLVSTVLTITFVPTIYYLVENR